MIHRRARKAARLARAQVRGGALVLVYHRISAPRDSPGRDPFRLCVGPDSFAEQIACLADLGTPVALSELADRLQRGRSVEGLICVTFDDGYLDNLQVAAPILRRYEVPATFFIVAGRVGESFWWDRLTALVYSIPEIPLPGNLSLEGSTETLQVSDLSTRGRARLLAELYARLKDLADEERSRAIDGLFTQLQAAAPELSRSMTWDEMEALVSDDRFELGGHTLTHPQLARQPAAAQRREMLECRIQLEDFLGRPVRSMAYPFGARQDVSRLTMKLAGEAGYELACGTELDVVSANSDPLRLPRFWVSDWGQDQFSSRVRRWFRPRGQG
jgi:peptidoglycan/xylan/chitin deacetylase (PgdA/CDA1 family)